MSQNRRPARACSSAQHDRNPAAALRWNAPLPDTTDMPVLLPMAARVSGDAAAERRAGTWTLRLGPAHGLALLLVFVVGCGVAQAQAGAGNPSVLATIWKWTPLLLRGFVFNLAISVVAIGAGTLAGMMLGFAQISLLPPVRGG